jgi:LuxR family transcriptional regulator, maltose regulon positive regulatory protein
LRKTAHPGPLPSIGTGFTPSDELLDYLAQEVLEKQDPPVLQFLLDTAILNEFNASVCDCLRGSTDSDHCIRYLIENGLFVMDLGNGHARYHPLFREFLLRQLTQEQMGSLHRRAAEYYLRIGEPGEAVGHLQSAGEFERLALELESLGEVQVREGRLDSLESVLSGLPPEVLEKHPLLMVRMGDIARLRSRFDEAFGWYRQAEEQSTLCNDLHTLSQALHGLARVYLDTVNPTQAENVLEKVLRLTDGYDDRENRAHLLELLAENRLNQGKPEEAERYQAQAQQIRDAGPSEAELSVRVLLRTGRLDEARRRLIDQVEAEQREPVLRPRAHRETHLVLSLILAFQAKVIWLFIMPGLGSKAVKPWTLPSSPQSDICARDMPVRFRRMESFCCCLPLLPKSRPHLRNPGRAPLEGGSLWGLCRAYGFRGEIEASGNPRPAGG